MALTLDTGALIALEARNRRVLALSVPDSGRAF